MDNTEIAERFTLLSKLMDIHGEDEFKIRSYSVAAFNIDKLPFQLKDSSAEDLFRIKGIGNAIGKKILDMIATGGFPLLDQYLEKTPPGILDMLSIKGLGPKKIVTIWKDLEVESLGELLYACNENRLLLYKGFGQKSQDNIRQSIEFYFANQGKFRYADIEPIARALETDLRDRLIPRPVCLTGAFRRQDLVIEQIELLAAAEPSLVKQSVQSGMELAGESDRILQYKLDGKLRVAIHTCSLDHFAWNLFETTGSVAFEDKFRAYTGMKTFESARSESDIFQDCGLQYIAPAMREGLEEIKLAEKQEIPQLIIPEDIRGIIHCHSNWSDGLHSLEQMAETCRDRGFEYLVISDHSRSAFYANGLNVERIKAQHAQIEQLNARMAPFRIFKSIESDILSEGLLDYPDEVLGSFDLVIASVHSNLKMTQEKAMRRLMVAIENPYTTILGHLTGRLLLSRPGYPLDHEKIIEACAVQGVVIELNAHPSRLDMDWRWIPYAVGKGVLISIDPDAHFTEGFNDIRYGVLAAQKGGLTASRNLSSFSLEQFTEFIRKRKIKKGI